MRKKEKRGTTEPGVRRGNRGARRRDDREDRDHG